MEEESAGTEADPPNTQASTVQPVNEVTEVQDRAVLLSDVGSHVTCGLCRGYLVNAYTITDCVHSCEFFLKLLITLCLLQLHIPHSKFT